MFNFITSLAVISFLWGSGFGNLGQEIVNYYPVKQVFAPTRIASNSLGIETTAKSFLIADASTGTIFLTKNQFDQMPIASITKLMTALVVLDDKSEWDKKVIITKEDQREGGIVYLMPGDEVTVKDLFYLMLVASSNEAAATLSRIKGDNDFVAKMNLKASALGMNQTNFYDATGLDPKNISSVNDLIKLAKAAFSKTEIASALTSSDYQFKVSNTKRSGRAINTDKLIDSFLNKGNYQIAGAKTGHLLEAGYCLLLEIKKDDKDLFLALLGSESQSNRWQEAKGLVDWVFRNYEWPKN
jgi:D-alanyl-D-alanine endopeptidase (penicillin-binding protein 7)